MCGIAGIYNFNKEPASQGLISLMTSILSHRGPDGSGIWHKGHVGLGHRRLKIIDLSDRAQQPMTNEDGSIWLTYNGEIYNYKELREILKSKGHMFISQSDSEVVLHAYESWDIKCLERFNGMFAFGLYDRKKEKLFLARDRLGIKPLFYHQDDKRLIFASEIKALLVDKTVKREIDYNNLITYLSFNYSAAPRTMFRNINQLCPSEILLIEDGHVKKLIYWKISFLSDESLSQKECDERFNELLNSAVKLRLVSDVPFGAFLSGDLSLIHVLYI